MFFRRTSLLRCFIFTESIRISPSFTSYNLNIRFIIVVLPAPVGPTMAILSPGFILKETLFNTISFSYAKVTFLNSISPLIPISKGFSGSGIISLFLRMVEILSIEESASCKILNLSPNCLKGL